MNETATLESNLHVHRAAAERQSVYRECQAEAVKFKWIESEKAGYDLGEQVIQRWVKDHWHGYLRARWVEHLQGKKVEKRIDTGVVLVTKSNMEQAEIKDLLNPPLEKYLK